MGGRVGRGAPYRTVSRPGTEANIFALGPLHPLQKYNDSQYRELQRSVKRFVNERSYYVSRALHVNHFLREYDNYIKRPNWAWTVNRALLFRALHAHFVGFYVLCFVGKVYLWPRIGLLSLGEAVWDEPAHTLACGLWKRPRSFLIGSHYRDNNS